MIVQVVGGPVVNVRLRATVTVPHLQVSSDVVEFGEVKCGECRIVNVQLHNYQAVRCDWSAVPTEDAKKQVTKQKLSLNVFTYADGSRGSKAIIGDSLSLSLSLCVCVCVCLSAA